MKQFISKVQDLGQKAAQLRQAVQGAPARVAGIREAVTATAGQLQQLRTDVQSTIDRLRTDGEAGLVQALQEIDQAVDLFLEAGFRLREVEVELGIAQRLVVQLAKVEDIPISRLRALSAGQAATRTIKAILEALVQAAELSTTLKLDHLVHHQLTVYTGLTPSVRLGLAPGVLTQPPPFPPPAPGTTIPVAEAPLRPERDAFGAGAFFERRAPAAQAPAPEASPVAPEAPTSPAETPVIPLPAGAATPSSSSLSGDWRRGALDRFKRMPELSRPGSSQTRG